MKDGGRYMSLQQVMILKEMEMTHGDQTQNIILLSILKKISGMESKYMNHATMYLALHTTTLQPKYVIIMIGVRMSIIRLSEP